MHRIPRSRKAWLVNGTGRRPDRDGWWVGYYEPEGRRQRRFETLADAKRAMRGIARDSLAWADEKTDRPILDVLREFLEAKQKRGLSAKHVRDLDVVLTAFCRAQQLRTATDITPEKCEAWLAELDRVQRNRQRTPTPISDATRFKRWTLLRTFCRWLERREFVAKSPLASVDPPRREKRRKRSPAADEWVKLLEAVCNRDVELPEREAWHLLILLAATTGIRKETLLRLKPGNFDLSRADGVAVISGYIERKTRQEEFRAVPAAVGEFIRRRLAECGDRLWPWTAFQRKQWEALKDRAGYAFTFHALRSASGVSSAIARLEAEGAKHLWHSSADVFSAHYSDAEKVAIAAALFVKLPPLPSPYFSAAGKSSAGRRRDRTG